MFITFEGIDLCGKSTQAKLLYDFFKKKKKKCILVREPGGTYISEKIRNILLDNDNHDMRYLTEFLLFSASRHQLVEQVIIPNLKKKFVVICDRYYDSSTAYQGFGGEIDLKMVGRINKFSTDNLVPDISFLININYKDSLRRKYKIKKVQDRIERKNLSYYNKVVKGYLEIASKNKKRFRVLDGKKSIEELHQEILSHLKSS
ncbi:MAG: dTMP kinase [Bacteroidetes bacterium]|nr:dTMP kinase [Bacteroidota bacterium]